MDKKTLKYGVNGVEGGGNKYKQMPNNKNNFTIHKNKLYNKNINTDKPYDTHIN